MVLLKKNSGKKLWKRALEIIPGGNGLLSKRPNRYAPDIWPTYFSKAKGCLVWDLDGNKYIDMAQMGVGTAILGYSNSEVDNAVKKIINLGVSSTLNAPEEPELAEKLLELNPFAGGVKFARSGGEAMSIAVRIARAYSKKSKVAFSGYHGWSDWYLAANLSGKNNLRQHLLPNLSARGIPKELEGTSIPFQYNNLLELKKVIKDNPDVGTIIIEGARYDFPSVEFLNEIQSISRKKNIVTILDEITSGWRVTDGGVYKLKKFTPDIVVYGKGMGNGYAISAVVGKKKVMSAAKDTFISSTLWTERVGFVAALKTIEILKREKVWKKLIKIGSLIGEGWNELSSKHNLKIKTTEFKPLITMKLDYGNLNAKLITFFTQEMLKRGYLAATSVYVSYAHTETIVKNYLKNLDEVFKIMSKSINDRTIEKKLKTKVREEGFITVKNEKK